MTYTPRLALPAPLSRARQGIAAWMTAHLDEVKPPGNIAVLDGARAVACLSVIAYHINMITGHQTHLWDVTGQPLLDSILLMGMSGVQLFFVLSGFLLFLPYARALLFSKDWPNAWGFYVRRALRIIPAYYVALFLSVMLAHPDYLQPHRWHELLLFVVFFQDSSQETFKQLVGPFWTLAVEWQFYLLLPWIALAIRWLTARLRPQGRFAPVALCLVGMVGWGLYSRFWGYYFSINPTATVGGVPRGVLNGILFFTYGSNGKSLEDFAVGMLASLCFVAAFEGAPKVRLRQWLRRLSPALALVGAGLLLVAAMQAYDLANNYSWPGLGQVFSNDGFLNELGFSLGYGCCLIALLAARARWQSIFVSVPLRWIGMISYSLYIWHLPLLQVFQYNLGPSLQTLPAPLAYAIFWAWVAVVIVPFSYLMYTTVERPGMRLSKRLRKGRATARAALPAPVAAPDPRDEPEAVALG